MMISAVMFSMLYFGQSFGFSSNLRTICTIAGAGKAAKFFDFNWKTQSWNLVFLVGAIIGGWIAKTFMTDGSGFELSQSTIEALAQLGFSKPDGVQPSELFSWEAVASIKGFLVLAMGGFMVGFGSRYAGVS